MLRRVMLRRVMLELRGAFLFRFRQPDPGLDVVHAHAARTIFRCSAFGVNNAATRGHPVDRAGFDHLRIAGGSRDAGFNLRTDR